MASLSQALLHPMLPRSAVQRDHDYFGHAVNTAARITALAGAGHAVITEPILPACEALGVAAHARTERSPPAEIF